MTDAQDLPTVLPCPCCGGKSSGNGKVRYGEAFAKEQGWSQSTFYYCNCMICGMNNQGLRGYDTPEKAIAAWNRRAPDDEIERLRAERVTIPEGYVVVPRSLLKDIRESRAGHDWSERGYWYADEQMDKKISDLLSASRKVST